MTELEFHFETELAFSAPVTEQVFALHCLPMQDAVQQTQAYTLHLDPAAAYTVQRDGFGSLAVCGSCREPHGHFTYCAEGLARVDLARRGPEEVNPALRYATALTAPDEAIRALWRSLPLAGQPPRAQAQLLLRAAADALRYTPGVTTTATTAAQALALGQGVCQDYAHLLLALARLSGFGARYCMGLIPGEGATHAWAELALPEGWVGCDATHARETDETYLRFAAGRDAADCFAERGVFRGFASQRQTVEMRLRPRV